MVAPDHCLEAVHPPFLAGPKKLRRPMRCGARHTAKAARANEMHVPGAGGTGSARQGHR
jgi:hypothetical protein